MNVPLDKVTLISSGIEGLQRQTAFDSAGTRSNRRLVPRRVRPEIQLPVWSAIKGTACWVHGGWVCINRINLETAVDGPQSFGKPAMAR